MQWTHDKLTAVAVGVGLLRSDSPVGAMHDDYPRHQIWYPESELDLLERDIDREIQELSHLRALSERLGDRITQKAVENDQMMLNIARTKEEIATVEQDLSATQAHAPGEGTMSTEDLIKGFDEIGKRINDIMCAFKQWYTPYADRPLSEHRARAIVDYLQASVFMKRAVPFVQLAIGHNLATITEGILYHHLSFALMGAVFYPFLPGAKRGDPEMLTLRQMQEEIRNKQPQDHTGRWRALTYKHALEQQPRHDTWCTGFVTMYIQEVSNLLKIVTGHDINNESLDIAGKITMQTFNLAAQFKDRSMTLCTETDYCVFMVHSGHECDSAFMEECYEGKRPSTEVALGTGLGLDLNTSIRDGEDYRQECKSAVRAPFLGNRGILSSG